MGSYNYLIIPKLKLRIVTKLEISDSNAYSQYSKDKFDNLFDYGKLPTNEYGGLDYPDNETKLNDIGDIPINKLMNMFKICNVADRIYENTLQEELLCYYLDLKEIKYFTLSEYDNELKKYKDFIVL